MECDAYGLSVSGRRSGADGRQQPVERRIVLHEKVQRRHPLGVAVLHLCQRIDLITEQVERQARVLDGIVPEVGQKLVALD